MGFWGPHSGFLWLRQAGLPFMATCGLLLRWLSLAAEDRLHVLRLWQLQLAGSGAPAR